MEAKTIIAIALVAVALLVLFFVIGMVKTCGSFTDVKKPEHALKLFVRFALAKGVITYGMELMLALFNIVQLVFNMLVLVGAVKMSDRIIREMMGL